MKQCNKNMIFYLPNKIDLTGQSGSSMRPLKMMDAFRSNGYNVDVVMGESKERKACIKKIKDSIKRGKTYDFVYSESSTMPTLLTDNHHLPLHPFLDFGFFNFCKKHSIKIGLFYRDIHWKFDLYKKKGGIKTKLAILFYKYDLYKYGKLIDYMYIPSEKFKSYLNKTNNYHIELLLPGCNIIPKKSNKTSDKLNIFYVGGISKDIYDFKKLLNVVNNMDNVELTLCCRKKEWDAPTNYYNDCNLKNINVIHETGDKLENYYNKADICSLLFKDSPYMNMAMPIKMFEYIGNHKPVVATKGTQAAEFVEKYDIGFVIDYQEKEIEKLFSKLLNNKDLLTTKMKNVDKIIPNSTWESRANKVIKDLMN